jgi:hypothetical protein
MRQYIANKINKLQNKKGSEVCFSKPDSGSNQPFLKDRPGAVSHPSPKLTDRTVRADAQ